MMFKNSRLLNAGYGRRKINESKINVEIRSLRYMNILPLMNKIENLVIRKQCMRCNR